MARPRLLYVLHQYDNPGGVELFTRSLIGALSDRYEIAVLVPDLLTRSVVLIKGDWEAERLPADAWPFPFTPYLLEQTAESVAKVLHLFAPDLVHVQHFLHWPLSIIDQVASTNAKVIVSLFDHYAITPDYGMRGIEDPTLATTPEYAQAMLGRADASRYLIDRQNAMRESLGRVHARTALSRYLARTMERVFPLAIEVLECGIDPFTPLPRPARSPIHFGYTGSMMRDKGVDVLLAAFAKVREAHPETQLHLYGAGEPPALPRGATHHGAYTRGDLPRICCEFDVAVIPSLVRETYSFVLSEMWMGGVPVIVSDIGALGDRVTDGVDGRRFPVGDVDALAGAMRWFLEDDSWRAWQLPRPMTLDQTCDEVNRLYQRVLAMP